MSAHNGVTEDLTGDLLRAGFTDFENDGALLSGQTFHENVPRPAYVRGEPDGDGKHHNWNGSAWVLTT